MPCVTQKWGASRSPPLPTRERRTVGLVFSRSRRADGLQRHLRLHGCGRIRTSGCKRSWMIEGGAAPRQPRQSR
ncbi:hypothetical protein M8494_07365 [Serratia ureilytica]